MRLRVISGLVGIPILLGALWVGGFLWLLLLAVVTCLAALEVLRLFSGRGAAPPRWSVVAGSLGILLSAYWSGRTGAMPSLGWLGGMAWAILWSVLLWGIWQGPTWSAFARAGLAVAAAMYIGGGFGSLYVLRAVTGGWPYLWVAVLGTWATDTAAFFVGRAIGRRKLIPQVSPNKTVAGFVGGLAAAGLVGLIFGVLTSGHPALWILVGLAIGLAAQLGDLVESALKREAGVKDSGRFLPGHGGVLDRFDSLLLAAPVAYHLMIWLP